MMCAISMPSKTACRTRPASLQAALRDSRALTRAVIDSLAAHVAVLDGSGRIVATNQAWERFGRENSPQPPQRTGVGVNYLRVCRSACGENSEQAAEVLDGLTRLLEGRADQFHLEYPCHSPSEQRWFLLQATRLTGGAGGVVLLHIDITRRKLLEGRLLEHEKLRLFTTGLINGQEDERRRIARELHDGLNQQIAVLAIELGLLARRDPDPQELQSSLGVLQRQAVELSDQVRRISHQLHPAALEHAGLAGALRSLCAEFGGREGLAVDLEVGRMEVLPAPLALCLYRVAQECLRNASRHSGAGRVTVYLGCDGESVRTVVTDNGRGFDPEAAASRGLGLVSMEERVDLLGGCLQVNSSAGQGTRIEARLPLAGNGS